MRKASANSRVTVWLWMRLAAFSCVSTVWLLRVGAASIASRRPCTVEGFYDAGAATSLPCPGVLPCEPGFYCTGGKKILCPAGTYGAEHELRRSDCSGACPAGFYCPIGTSSPVECGDAQLFCPLGSAAPQRVPSGSYSTGTMGRRRDRVVACDPGFYCSAGARYPCPAGTYGSTSGLQSAICTSECPAGHYCPEGSISPITCPVGTYGARTGETQPTCYGQCREGYYCPAGSISVTSVPCGVGMYCPRGSASPQQAQPGQYVINGDSKVATRPVGCPMGSYCTSIDGSAELCPPGTYGDRVGLTSSACSGKCAAGYYCPRGSTTATQVVCGGSDLFCPTGSALPTKVSVGFYTTGKISIAGQDQDPTDETTRSGQRKCEPGHYSLDGVRVACAAARFGSTFGLASSDCSGPCRAGFFCPLRSIVATARRCGSSDWFCPEGSALPTRVDQGYCSTGGDTAGLTQSTQRQAGPGEFAYLGTCYLCPAGSYGDSQGETNPRCAGDCLPGYYCPPGSSRPTEKECGGADVYCPSGSKRPLPVATGFYTSINLQELCPPGKYRDLSTTTNAFLDLVTGRSSLAVNYGDFLYPLAQCVPCPVDTYKPAYGDDSTLCVPCPALVASSLADRRTCDCFRLPGGSGFDSTTAKLRFNGVTCELKPLSWVEPAPVEAQRSLFTRYAQFPCELGYFCQNGIRTPCPGGFYGETAYETRAQCSGPCAPGFFCPLATNGTARVCGDVSVYCPQGSAVPRPVTPGFFTIRSVATMKPSTYTSLNASWNGHIRDSQRQCERGYYCVMGQQFICPAGRYGDQPGETSPLCAGQCKRGFYCPPGSTSPTERVCGGSQWVCRTGSPSPVLISTGYYSVGGDPSSNTTRFHQQPCEPGYFCVDGVKYQCPAGTYGAISGLGTPSCSGFCRAGYHCPSYPYPPSTSGTQTKCGNSTVYCPKATGNFPLLVQSGFFSLGAGDGTGDASNTTRVAQQRCPKGFYCRNGIQIRCPEGTYGDQEGLTSTQCSGWCPAGWFCPPGTADYRANACPSGTFAIAGSGYCMPCSANQSANVVPETFHLVSDLERESPCTDTRECCFFG